MPALYMERCFGRHFSLLNALLVLIFGVDGVLMLARKQVIYVSDLKRCSHTNMHCTRPTCSRCIYLRSPIDRANNHSRSPSKVVSIHCVSFVASVSLATTSCSCTCANGTKSALYANETRFDINSTCRLVVALPCFGDVFRW